MKRLAENDVQDARLEAEVLLRHCMGVDRAEFFAQIHDFANMVVRESLSDMLMRRLHGEPLAYLLGTKEFYGLDMYVNPDVLIPRQETELLVDCVLEWCKVMNKEHPVVLDIGTGSGAIAVAVARHVPGVTVYATDNSSAALSVAAVNVNKHDVEGSVRLIECDLLGSIQESADVIVSNPPYLTTDQLSCVQPEVLREPRSSLDGGPDGLNTIERLLVQSVGKILLGGIVLIEISPGLAGGARILAEEAFPGSSVGFHCDLSGQVRVMSITCSDSPVPLSADGYAGTLVKEYVAIK